MCAWLFVCRYFHMYTGAGVRGSCITWVLGPGALKEENIFLTAEPCLPPQDWHPYNKRQDNKRRVCQVYLIQVLHDIKAFRKKKKTQRHRESCLVFVLSFGEEQTGMWTVVESKHMILCICKFGMQDQHPFPPPRQEGDCPDPVLPATAALSSRVWRFFHIERILWVTSSLTSYNLPAPLLHSSLSLEGRECSVNAPLMAEHAALLSDCWPAASFFLSWSRLWAALIRGMRKKFN